MGLIKDYSVAVDGGANVGDWSAILAQHFETVYAFEPSAETFMELKERLGHLPQMQSFKMALLDRCELVTVITPEKRPISRSRYVQRDPGGEVHAIALDDMALSECGLLKLDVEGSEYHALMGARETVDRCCPVLIIEVDKHLKYLGSTEEQLLGLVADYGYEHVFSRGPDRIYVKP